jgi:heme-degrading monooxygenase HmoA
VYTTATWNVKEGREDEFVRRWQESADGTSLRNPGVAFKLYRSREHPRRYVSMGEGWRHAEQVEAVRESPEFQDSLASIWRVLESGELGTLDLVVEIS